jgi:nitronate monooxygenase
MAMYDPGRLFGLPTPIIQAPMAGVATPALAAAVSNAGGMGSLGLGMSTVAQAQQLISETRALTERPFNVNLFCHQPAERDAEREAAWIHHLAPLFAEVGADPPTALKEISTSFLIDEDMQRLILELHPAIVSFHFGLPPAGYLAALREAGIRTLATATNQREAAVIEAAGIDAIVAQGIEAGGHRGMFDPGAEDERLSTAVLVRLLTRQTSLPIVAAGGIMDGAGVRASLELGAVGVQMGTAFILCPESAASESYRANLKSERAEVTRLTSVLSGRPARGMVNQLIRHGEAPGNPRPAAYPVAYDAARQLNAAAMQQGNHEFAAQWAGQGAPLARELPAATLVATIMEEFRAQGS